MEYAKLANGMQMPMLGYGVFQIDDEKPPSVASARRWRPVIA